MIYVHNTCMVSYTYVDNADIDPSIARSHLHNMWCVCVYVLIRVHTCICIYVHMLYACVCRCMYVM